MLRCSSLVILSIILIPLVTEVAVSRPLSPSFQYPEVQSEIDLPICYIQIADGRTLNLQKLCGKVFPINKNAYSRISKAKFRRGSGGSYASDSLYSITKIKHFTSK